MCALQSVSFGGLELAAAWAECCHSVLTFRVISLARVSFVTSCYLLLYTEIHRLM